MNPTVPREELIIVGSKIYASCPYCKTLVRLNKPIFGSLHLCSKSVKEGK